MFCIDTSEERDQGKVIVLCIDTSEESKGRFERCHWRCEHFEQAKSVTCELATPTHTQWKGCLQYRQLTWEA